MLAESAPGMTFGEARHAARKLVLTLDPEAANKRKEAAKREAHVRRFREESGNAGMVARELPSDEVLASWRGPSCQCNLSPLCRRHHRCKQAEGRSLEQPEPGVLRWRVPSGRTYSTAPTQYAS